MRSRTEALASSVPAEDEREPELDEAGESDFQERLERHEASLRELPPLLQEHALFGADAIRSASRRATSYFWKGIAIPGNVIAFVGLPGDGKTTAFALTLTARRNRSGKPIAVFGRELQPAPADKLLVFIENEHNENSAARKLERAREMHGLDEDTFEGTLVLGRKDVTVGSDLWAEVCDLIAQGKVDSVWIDSLARFVDEASEANAEKDQVAVFAEVQRAIESSPDECKPTVWIVAHSNKGGKGVDVRDMSGSVQRAAQVDVAVTITADRGDDGAVASARAVFVKIREADDEWPPACVFRVAKVEGKWTVAWDGAKTEAVDGRAAHEKVFALLAREGKLTASQIKQKLNLSGAAVKAASDVLKAQQRISFQRGKAGGQPCWFLQAKDDAILKEAGILVVHEVDNELF